MSIDIATDRDLAVLEAQLGRPMRGVVGIAWRCHDGNPGVVATAPRLPNGTPFPTSFYLSCPVAIRGCSRLEASGLMNEMNARLGSDEDLAQAYAEAHRSYLASRAELGRVSGVGDVPEIDDFSAGGMPSRVKCLHALVGHALAAGPGVNPLGDETVALLGEFWLEPCLAE
ncbi:DUF501 domain-containing protein [Parenemella sanctibonifatiensis]|uniref:DUF501 domain-containing protein n=1 Tax=Parenemella sanctibonifatiensis TaxID=2016505 RepID=A0A255EG35_9ACTN|nr:DUF501 domain-containing protein [Parenemella sanctibonifatiensis]OYN90487.1 hypothetical protein CGZ92_01245 [Parenemella sanctibonifatiensis]